MFNTMYANNMTYMNTNIDLNMVFNTKDYIKEAIAMVESGNRNISGNTNDVGHLQETPIFVDECNRIVGYKKFEYNDRWDKDKSEEMYYIYQNYYNPKYDFELACIVHHGYTTKQEHERYFNLCKIEIMKLILKDCSPSHKSMIMQYISELKNVKHNIVTVTTKEINTSISLLNSREALNISFSSTLINIPINIGNIIKDLI